MADGGKTLKRRGGPSDESIKAGAERVASKMQKYSNQYRAPAQIRQDPDGADRGDTTAIDFPVKISAPDDRDTAKELKADMAATNNGVSPFGQVHATDEDFEYLAQKRDQIERFGYQKFLAKSFDLTNPAERELLEKVAPDYYKSREEEINQQAELQKRLAHIRLRGPRSEEDMMTLWAIHTKRIPMPEGPLWDPASWTTTSSEQGSFNRGLFNPRRLFPKDSKMSGHNWDKLGGPGVPNRGIQTALAGNSATRDRLGTMFGANVWKW